MQSIWTIVVIAGPILLLAALIYMTIRNKMRSTPSSEALTERATKMRREEREDEPKAVDGPLG